MLADARIAIQQQIVAQLVVGVQRGAVEPRLHRLGGRAGRARGRPDRRFVGELVDPAIIRVLDPAIRLAQRRQRQLGLVIGLEESGERRVARRNGAGRAAGAAAIGGCSVSGADGAVAQAASNKAVETSSK